MTKSYKHDIEKNKSSLNLATQIQVDCLHDACAADEEGQLQVDILLDCTRGSRGEVNSRTMLLPLLRDFPSKVRVALYHTPNLRGYLQRWMPDRFNEIVGVAHLKVYLFDDNLLMSG